MSEINNVIFDLFTIQEVNDNALHAGLTAAGAGLGAGVGRIINR